MYVINCSIGDDFSALLMQKILQRTPIRVLHRRSPLEREKIIHWLASFQYLFSTNMYIFKIQNA